MCDWHNKGCITHIGICSCSGVRSQLFIHRRSDDRTGSGRNRLGTEDDHEEFGTGTLPQTDHMEAEN